MTLTVGDGTFKLTQKLTYLLYFCFSANIWNVFSGGSRALRHLKWSKALYFSRSWKE